MKRFLLLIFVLGIGSQVFAQSENVDIIAFADNTIYSDNNNASNGSGIHLFSGETLRNGSRRALLRFDIAANVPEGATINSVSLTMRMNRSNAPSFDFELFRLTKDWGEGASDASGQEGGGGAAQTNDATWTNNFFGSSSWDNPGGDFNTLLSTLSVGGISVYTWPTTANFVNTVQDWLDNPGQNFGLIMVGPEGEGQTSKRFNSREAENDKPFLTVNYTVNSTSNEDESEIPTTAELEQNYPNPFNPTTNISFALPEAAQVQLNVYDIVGRKVATVFDGFRSAGSHQFTFDAANLSSGIYIYTLESANFMLSRKLTLIK